MSAEKNLLTVKDLVVEYPGKGLFAKPFRVLHGVSVEIGEGETVGLVGESGSGKTTIGRAVLGLAPVTEGTITLEGNDISHASRKARQKLSRDLQVVFQDPYTSLNPAMTVGDILSEPLGIQGITGPDARKRVKELLDRVLPTKLALLADAGVQACVGGTLLEIAWMQGKADECLDWAHEVGFPCVEVSRGVAPMPLESKVELIHRAAGRFVVLAEVGRKDARTPPDPAQWADEVSGDLTAGARWVVAEGRESGTVGLYHADGTVREDVVAASLRGAPVERVLFEAPRKDQQAWFVNMLGPDVNLANVALDDALALETLRLGLRADTFALHAQRVTT